MAYVVIQINVPNLTEAQVNGIVSKSDAHDAAEQLKQLIEKVENGFVSGSINAITKATSTALTADGGGVSNSWSYT
jgi:hypothetical protein